MKLLQNVGVQWFIRRIPDWGGWVGSILGGLWLMYSGLTPGQQNMINGLLAGNWQDITLGSLVPFVVLVYSQIISYRKTVQPQIVQKVDGQAVSVPLKEVAPSTVERVAAAPAPRKTLVDILLGK